MITSRIKNLCIVQARVSSTRFPGKVLKKVNGLALLEHELRRLKRSVMVDCLVVATSSNPEDAGIERICARQRISCFRGSLDDVLDRFYQCAMTFRAPPTIVRITGDCPLIDSNVLDDMLKQFPKLQCDYLTNTNPPTFPDGMDIEIFKFTALKAAWRNARLVSEREHVTPYIRNHRNFTKKNISAPADFSHFRITVDNPEDLPVIRYLLTKAPKNAGYLELISLLTKDPRAMLSNMHIARNEGYAKSLREDSTTSHH